MPKVSIIIPAYNCEKFITDTLESIFNQTYKDYEIIVVDDGSTDQTATILKRYTDKIKYIYQLNRGQSQARNNALLHARGEYIAFLDHDDAWLPEKLKMQLSLLEENRDIGLVYSDMYLLDDKLFTLPQMRGPRFFQKGRPCRGRVFDNLILNNFIPISTVVVRKECFERVGIFNPSFPPAEDYDCWLRIAVHYLVDYIDKPLVKYRLHQNCQGNDTVLSITKAIEVINGISKYCALDRKIVNKRLFFLYFHLGEAYFFRDGLKNAKINFFTAFKFGCSFKALLFFALTFLEGNNFLLIKKIKKLFQKQREKNDV